MRKENKMMLDFLRENGLQQITRVKLIRKGSFKNTWRLYKKIFLIYLKKRK